MKFYQTWQGRALGTENSEWFSASVPGNIQKDYAVANGFADWQYADGYKQFLPLEDLDWEYRASLSFEKKEGERVYFVTEGISYKYDILLGGEVIYSYEGMFKPARIDITDRLTDSENILTVHIYPHPKSSRGCRGTRDEANESCIPPVMYGWDWNPRLLMSGMWDEAYIETRDSSYISDTEVLCRLSDDMTVGFVDASWLCGEDCELILLDHEGNEVFRGRERSFTVTRPNLWWCNGQGEPYLYTWIIRNSRHEVSGNIGFRKIRLVRNTGANGPAEFPKSRYEAPITVELNGRRIFAKGSNWVNPELFWGDITEERYRTLISLAKDCNMNIFRMWGGAGAPKKSFYDICDREGIMIWQEFMLACNEYIDTGSYMQVLEKEATAIIKKFRAHPSLAFWCGGNELFNSWSGMDEQSYPLRLLNKLCLELDYDRPFIYTSPLFGMAHGGYVFYSEDQGGDAFNQFIRSNNTAYTEFGIPSLADADTLKEIIPENELFPVVKTAAWTAHHAFGAWGDKRWLCAEVMEKYFGKADSLEELLRQSQWLQCEGYRGAFEEMRRQWPHCSMAINWCYNEPWKTAAGNELIAYPERPKAAYEYVKLALRPTLFSARIPKIDWRAGECFEAELWLLNDAPSDASGKVRATLTVGTESYELIEWEACVTRGENRRGPTVRMTLPDLGYSSIITLTLSSENAGTESKYELLYYPKKPRSAVRILNM
ncbi:MAG: hypothetical protein E7617_01610 [Ruminococcaceae bacterium]|nr:hypothetical protein [Oscillospiraceae bacterium]